VYSFLLNKDISEKNVHLCYLFYGEEPFLASEFIDLLKESLSTPDEEGFPVERMDLAEQTWADVIDLARTIPFFFTAWRLIDIKVPKFSAEKLSQTEEEILKAYFASPTAQTVLILVIPEKMKKNFALLKCLSSFPDVYVRELKSLKGSRLSGWIDRKLDHAGKVAAQDAKERLVEMTGRDLAYLNNEIEKIITYVDEKKVIELDDVNQVSGWVKSFVEWELTNSFERRDYRQSVIVLNKLLAKENTPPERILGTVSRFFRDILLAKLWLKQRKSKQIVFRALRPHIQPDFPFYNEKFRMFFSLTENISMTRLKELISRLEEIDLKIKTSDLSPQVMMEEFIFDYCRGKGDNPTWGEMR
jgi:DNA polymerase III delta subunit